MVTIIHLVRHGSHVLPPGVLAGRMPGVGLSDEGRLQARRAADRLSGEAVGAVHCSPLERTRETAAIIADRLSVTPIHVDALTEIDFGGWTGRTFEDLDRESDWRRWNHFRTGSRPPGGETMLEAQARALRHIETLTPGNATVLVSHCDVIRAVLTHWLGMPMDMLLRLEIAPGSISTVEIGPWGPRILRINGES
jgi:ribonuclease H / adenosylcobalamin/alpha-ribazole phosphatase